MPHSISHSDACLPYSTKVGHPPSNPTTGQIHNSSGLSILLVALRGDKDFNFAGDIQIVGPTSRQASSLAHWVAVNGQAQFATTAISESTTVDDTMSLR